MRASALIVSQAAVWVCFASALIVVPEPLVSLFGEGSGPLTVAVARILGAELTGLAIVSVATRRTAAVRPRSGLILGYIVSNAVGAAVTLAATAAGAFNALGWGLVGSTSSTR